MDSQTKHSVLIIGAGLSGLTTADQILKEYPSTQVMIIEAMAEAGGRTRSIQVNGAIFDLGGQWIGANQKFVLELAKRSGNPIIDQHYKGKRLLQFGEEIQIYQSHIPKEIGTIPILYFDYIIKRLDRMAKTVPLDSPRLCPSAMYWDSMTFHTWVQQHIWFDKIRRFMQLIVRSLIGCQTNEISFLYFLWYVHHNNGINCMLSIQNGLQNKKFVNGTQFMSKFLEKEVIRRGAKIHYNSFVNNVSQDQKGVTVTTRNGNKYQGDYLVITVPPPVLKHIEFQPQLSRQRRFISDRYVMGNYSKMIVLYKKNYWRQSGFSGENLSDCHKDPVLSTYDDTRPRKDGTEQPAIVVFFAAAIDEEWTKNKEECKKVVIQKLAEHYKCLEMLHPVAIEMKVWNQQESVGGAPSAYTPPGVLTKINNIREPEGRIHWAGTQTANISQGYMDGAIESGIRVSKEIIGRFKGKHPQPKQVAGSAKWYSQIMTFKRPHYLKRIAFL